MATTSRAPACIARASRAVSRAGRTKTTLVVGRDDRRLSQTVTPSPNEMFGPSTTTYSSGCWASHGSSRSVVSTDWQPGGQGTEQPPGCGAVGIDDDGHVSSLGEQGLDHGGRAGTRA